MVVVKTDEENNNRCCRNAKSNGFFGQRKKSVLFAFLLLCVFQKKLTVGNLKLTPKLTVNLPPPVHKTMDRLQ
jgi:hypothetical protein